MEPNWKKDDIFKSQKIRIGFEIFVDFMLLVFFSLFLVSFSWAFSFIFPCLFFADMSYPKYWSPFL